jgi:ring-1,2-phenylacetyl-CoA epoxidase subunit PaaE
LGVEADRIHGEHFTVATTTAVGGIPEPVAASASGAISVEFVDAPPGAIVVEFDAPPVEPTPASDQAEVIVLMDGRRRTFNMRMNDELVLDAAIRAGLELPFSCRAGVCSTCRTKLVRGEVEMEQNYALEDWEVEQGYVLACQARVKTPVLELNYDEK